ncbi:MAG: ABC transporter substrate-binding protein [Treponema sp.]|jgi:iron complex transport system substrate-binding protein|nr:ABC transporter substrate-binding protein [Treponema sp.]
MNRNYLLFFILFVLLSGCAEKPITGSGGRIIDHPPAINRIMSAAPSNTEIIAGLGLADKLVAVDKYSKDVEGIQKDLPEIDLFYPDMESIAGLKPDIIFAAEINTNGRDETGFEFFRNLGVRIIQIPTSNSIEEIYGTIIFIAQALGAEEKGEDLVRIMKEKIKSVVQSVEVSGTEKSVYFEIAPVPNMVSFGRGTYLNELIEITGARNIFAGEKRWFTPSSEAVIRSNPDVIFVLDGKDNMTADGTAAIAELKKRPGFQTITAVRRNRIYPINGNHASRPSQNIVLTLEEMYRAVYSE